MISAAKLDRAREMICGVTSADKSTAISFRNLLKSALPDNIRSGQQSVLFARANEQFVELLAAINAENHTAIQKSRDTSLAALNDLEKLFS
ncbi:hypothetical protein [Ahrensia marina]|uniref:Uncharacterized protein n=1 Tax=Ahrensia marina TaxID=1514904 RepID=A0A0M9GMJ9_9HYPH|nr:hypothetical protein [Ahrensia marina]KPB00976.1 hypothetical protein SU32_11270 [Ahrensia marina]